MTKKKSTRSAFCAGLMAMVLCCTMLMEISYAWFSDTVQNANNKIVTGSYDVNIEVDFVKFDPAVSEVNLATLDLDTDLVADLDTELDVASEEPDNNLIKDGTYIFPEHGKATFTLTATGTATEGYGVVTIGEETYFTGNISTKIDDNSYTFSITALEGSEVSIKTMWGSIENAANAEEKLIKNNAIELLTEAELIELTATPTPVPSVSPSPSLSPSPSPEATVEPTASPEATVEPTVSPEATVEPTASPEATVEPTASPEATVEPTASPEATVEPTASPEATVEPSLSLEATIEPTVSPEATVEPTASPEATIEPTVSPEAQ